MAELRLSGWRWRALVAEAIVRLMLARAAIGTVPFKFWRRRLGPLLADYGEKAEPSAAVRRLARAVERAAVRLPFETKCLPRAIALHGMLQQRRLPSVLVLGVLDPKARGTIEDLHAWVQSGSAVVIGALDQPFHAIAAFGKAD